MTVWVSHNLVDIWGPSEQRVLVQAQAWQEIGWELSGPPGQDYAPHCARWHAMLLHA